eukprot:9467068-Pyramimonas_sp.AAC.1
MELTESEKRPTFRWPGSYLSHGQAVGKECDLFDWIENQWADFFAGLGRDDVSPSESPVRGCQLKFDSSVDAITALGQLAQRHAEWALKLK